MNTQPDTLTLVLLGTIATLSVLQGLALLGAALMAFRAVRRTESVAGRLGVGLRPAIHDLSRATREAVDVSELVLAQARRLDAVINETLEKVDRAQSALHRLLPTARRIATAATAFHLLRSGVRAVRRLRR